MIALCMQTIMIAKSAENAKKSAIMIESKEAFDFYQKIDKREVYVGEPIVLTYIFKQRRDIELAEANFHASPFENFWAKRTKAVPNRIEDGYNIYTIHYLLYPQKSGNLRIGAGRMDIGILASQSRDFFKFQRAKWKTFTTKSTEVVVKPLPAGVKLYGDYTFDVVADKRVTNANEPVNLTITIRGQGNVDDIEDFTLDVADATVYADKAKRSFDLIDEKNVILFKQKFAIVSDRNFTIPSLSLTFFNGEVKVLHSRIFPIEVKGSSAKAPAVHLEKKIIKEEKVSNKSLSKASIMIASALSFLLGIVLTVFFMFWKKSVKQASEKPIEKKIREAKGEKELLGLLLPYLHHSKKIENIIKELEANIYGNASYKIDTKSLSKAFSGYLTDANREEDDILQ